MIARKVVDMWTLLHLGPWRYFYTYNYLFFSAFPMFSWVWLSFFSYIIQILPKLCSGIAFIKYSSTLISRLLVMFSISWRRLFANFIRTCSLELIERGWDLIMWYENWQIEIFSFIFFTLFFLHFCYLLFE